MGGKFHQSLIDAHKARLRRIARMVPVDLPPWPWLKERPMPNKHEALLRCLIQEVADAHGYPVGLIRGHRRSPLLARARQEFCYRASDETGATITAIARFLNNRDHSTIAYSIRAHALHTGKPMPRGTAHDAYWKRQLIEKMLRCGPKAENSLSASSGSEAALEAR